VESFADIDLAFARSRRRAERRREVPPQRSLLARRSVRAAVLAVVLLAVSAQSTRLESSQATTSTRPPARLAPSAGACPIPRRFSTAFATASATTGLSASLLVATAYEESRMNPAARSSAGATGLLQLMPTTARELRLTGDDPAANVLAGARYLRGLLDRFGSLELALAAYNAGPTAVERAGGAPTIATLRYVKNIEARAARLGC
jgi:soluble lytic murein transglycosylase-like protein